MNQDTLVDLSLLAFRLEEGLADKLTAERAVLRGISLSVSRMWTSSQLWC